MRHPFFQRRKKAPIWPEGKGCAISLTYDDAFESHWREVAPALEERGWRGTFYVPIRAALWNHTEEWREVARRGHELGNHTVFHPCRRNSGRDEAFQRDDLSGYTAEEFRRELEVANAYLSLLDGRKRRTYGNTCHHTTIGRGDEETSMASVLRELFPAARGPRREDFTSAPVVGLDVYEVGCISSYRLPDFQHAIDHALKTGGWLIICLHDVAEREERLRIARSEHLALLDTLARNTGIWVSPVLVVADRLGQTDFLSEQLNP